MNEVYLLLGSNEGEREKNLQQALELLQASVGSLLKASTVYETEAWGLKEQSAFLNQAVCFSVALTPLQLLQKAKVIEKEMGRTVTTKWGPRVIDIDILLYGNKEVTLPELKVPHLFLHERRFTLTPLNEIASGVIHPVLNKTIEELLQACKDNSSVKLFSKHEK